MKVPVVKKANFALCRVVAGEAGASWYHTIPPVGEYPGCQIHMPGEEEPRKNQVIVIEAADYAEILRAFRVDQTDPSFHGLLVDKEHFSLDTDKSSEAFAWGEDMRIDADGIWTRWAITAIGKPMLEGDVYRSRSPVFEVAAKDGRPDCWRITRVTGIGLTNTPFFENLSPDARARRENQKGADMLLEQLRARLKLDAAADEQTVLARVSEALDKGDADATALGKASARVTELETAQRDREWDAFAAANKDRITDVAVVQARFKANPDDVKALFAATKPAAPQGAPSRLGQGAETPASSAKSAEPKLDRDAVRRLAADLVKNTGCSQSTAVCRAERLLRAQKQKGS
jgi:hypothetical protein